MAFSHIPVLFNETIDSLRVKPDGVYVDCTAGGGGHSLEIAKRLPEGSRLICLDRDDDAIAACTERLAQYKDKCTIVKSNFTDIAAVLDDLGIDRINGALWDLGVSSHQLDDAERGFSYMQDAPLDMRMDTSSPLSANEAELRRILYAYGEEKFAPSIAKRIVEERAKKPIETTFELAEIVKSGIPARARREGGHPARRSFQAIRIEVNGELQHLEQSVEAMFSVLNVGGVLSVITFHSLEDRAVKLTFRKLCEGCTCPPSFPVCVCGKTPRGKLAGKPVVPSEEELAENPRARSARLRSIERLK